MYIFTKKFWIDFRHNPKNVIDTLEKLGSIVLAPIVRFFVFWRIVFSEYWINHAFIRASGLAFTILLTIIPLMASLSFMLASFIEVHPKQVEDIVMLFLPFAPPGIVDHINAFFENAQKLRGIGIAVFIFLTVGLFGAVEDSLNAIWKVVKARSFFVRLRTFTMVMIYGPLLIYLSFHLRSRGLLNILEVYYWYIFQVISFLMMVFAFTLISWLMPNTKVKFKYAFLGGLIAGILFELERRGFSTYIQMSIETRTIYGAYGIIPFFLVSLFLVSLFILFGSQVSYVAQNFRPLLRARNRWERRVSDYKTYLSLRIIIDVFDAFNKKNPPLSLFYFSKKYELTNAQASGILNSLIFNGYIHVVGGKDLYAPACDLSVMPVGDLLDKIEYEYRKIPTIPDDLTKVYISKLLEFQKSSLDPTLQNLTLFKLTQVLDAEVNKQ